MVDSFEDGFDYSINLETLKQGAEARIFDCIYLGRPGVVKERFSKKYRHPILDERLNTSRTKNELIGIVNAQKLGVSTPNILFVDDGNNRIIMEKIEGVTVRDWIEKKRVVVPEEFQSIICNLGKLLGEQIGKLHKGNLIHGDLTTSNIILRNGQANLLVFIDFGLSLQGKISAENKGVDLYVLERAIASTHVNADNMFSAILEGYLITNAKHGPAVIKKLDEIRLRGRKRDMIG